MGDVLALLQKEESLSCRYAKGACPKITNYVIVLHSCLTVMLSEKTVDQGTEGSLFRKDKIEVISVLSGLIPHNAPMDLNCIFYERKSVASAWLVCCIGAPVLVFKNP